MRLMEWNIHGKGGYGNYSMPAKMITNTIKSMKPIPDVIVLLEFIKSAEGYNELQECFTKLGFDIFTTNNKSLNGVLIAINSCYSPKFIKEEVEYLEVGVNLSDNRVVSIIGMRILTQGTYSKFAKRRELFKSRLDAISHGKKDFILMFDANNGAIQYEVNKYYRYLECERKEYNYQYIWRCVEDDYKWAIITPDKGGPYIKGKYSIVTGKNHPENYHTKEDHIISSFKESYFTNIDYLWDFVNEDNGYGKLKSTDFLGELEGLPDHAILVADFDFK